MEEVKHIEVFPNKIILTRSFQQNYYEAKLTITNLTDKYVVFKVYINKSTTYSANPSTSFIKPREQVVVNIKRVEKDVNLNEMAKDKFLILAFPVNKVISDMNEARDIIKNTNLKSQTNQEIYLEAEFENMTSSQIGDLRKTMNTMNSVSTFNENENLFGRSTISHSNYPLIDGSSINYSTTSTRVLSPQQELEEIKKQIEELKKNIQNYESENSKLNLMLNNYVSNSLLYKTKNKVLSKGDQDKEVSNNKFPLSFVVLLLTIGLTLGAYIHHLI